MCRDSLSPKIVVLSVSFAPVILAAACAQAPTSPNQAPVLIANAADGAAGTDRPFSGDCRTEFQVLTNPPGEAELPPSTEGLTTKGIIRITGTCTLTHLGNSTLEAVQRLEGPPATPPEVVTRLQNLGSYTAANGDILRFGMVGDVRPGDAQWPVQFSGTTVFRGGTGRFVTASGSARFEGGARFESPMTGVGYFTHSEGAISY